MTQFLYTNKVLDNKENYRKALNKKQIQTRRELRN